MVTSSANVAKLHTKEIKSKLSVSLLSRFKFARQRKQEIPYEAPAFIVQKLCKYARTPFCTRFVLCKSCTNRGQNAYNERINASQSFRLHFLPYSANFTAHRFFPESEQVPAIIQPAISLYLNLHTMTTGLSSGCNFAAISFSFPFNLPFSNAFIKASAP